MELISKEVVKRIIDSGRTKEQMLGMVECAVTYGLWKNSSTKSSTDTSDSSTDSTTDSSTGAFDDDCISREAVLNALYALCDTGETLKENPWRDNPCIDAVVEAMEQLPSVRPKERTWEWQQGEIDWYKLGKCIEKGFRKGLKG